MELRPYWYNSGRRRVYRVVPPVLIDHLPEEKKEQAYYCAQTFCEQYETVHARYFYSAQAALAMREHTYSRGTSLATGGDDPQEPGLDSLQHDFVNHSESFYQSFYSLVSWLFRLVSLTAPHGSFRGVSLGSVSRGLDGIQRMALTECLCDSVSEVRRVLRVRNDFIVHPDVTRPWSWITAGSNGEYRIVYFFIRADRTRARPSLRRRRLFPQPVLDVDDPVFNPPVEHDGFVIAPHPTRAIASLDEIVRVLLDTVERFVGNQRSGRFRVLRAQGEEPR